MAKLCGKVMVGESARQNILMFVIILNVIMAFLQLTVISSGVKIKSRYQEAFGLVPNLNETTLHILLITAGVIGIFYSTIEILMSWINTSVSNRRRGSKFLLVLLVINLIEAMLYLWCLWFERKQGWQFRNGLKHKMNEAFEKYKSFPKYKEKFDVTQQRFQCCGLNNFTDWLKNSWIDEELADKRRQMVPFSCCSPFAKRTCIMADILKGTHENYDPSKDLTIFQESCPDRILEEYEQFVLYNVCIPCCLLILFNLLACACLRYVQTSIKGALKMGYAALPSHGFLLVFGKRDNEFEFLASKNFVKNHKNNKNGVKN